MKFPFRIVSRSWYEKMSSAKEASALYNQLRHLQKIENLAGGTVMRSSALETLKNEHTFNVLDIGANYGDWAMAFHGLFPESKIYSIEADPDTYKVLCKNTEHLSKIQPINALLSSKVEKVTFYSNNISVFSSVQPPPEGIGLSTPIALASKTLDKVLDEQEIESVKLLKIDTEGHDLEVLKGGGGIISKPSLQFIIVEFGIDPENRRKIHINKFLSFLLERGFALVSVGDWCLSYEPFQFGNALFRRI
jgi:FkbM family methyltransferase